MPSRQRTARRSLSTVLVAGFGLVAAEAHAESLPYQFEIGPSFGYAAHTARENAANVAYQGAVVSKALMIRLRFLRYFRLSGQFMHTTHDVELPAGSLGTPAQHLESDALRFETLQAALHPTLPIGDRVHVWATLGLGWSYIYVPPVKLDPPSGSIVHYRQGVFLEAPLGLGGCVDVIPRWLTISYNGTYAPAFSQSGDMFEPYPYVNAQGQNAFAGPMPKVRGSHYHLVTAAIVF
jgi:hypothetical protein